MNRVFNFCAGPAALPEEVLLQAQREMLDWQGLGASIMELSHRSEAVMAMAAEAEQDLRDLLNISKDYAVLFMQGGASAQFSAVPLNLLPEGGSADYLNTGIWSKKAIAEAKRYGRVNVVATAEADNFSTVPAFDSWRLSDKAAYLHYTPNETIGGLELDFIPDAGAVPLVADYSSSILSQPLDVSRFGLIYAGAQKNIGPSGLVVVIVRRDLLGRARAQTPLILDYQIAADNDSMYNTPATFSWYLAGLVFKWLKAQGGLASMGEINRRKANKLYAAIDQSQFYSNPIAVAHRSHMNVPFKLADESLNEAFLEQADARGLLNLRGHRSVGGMRASIYNAVPEAAVDALIAFMAEFEKEH